MTIEKKIDGEAVTFTVSGRLDTQTAPELEKELDASLLGIKDLTFDMTGLEYVSSAGLRVILTAQKKMNIQGSMELINVSEAVMDIFEMTGFAEILVIK